MNRGHLIQWCNRRHIKHITYRRTVTQGVWILVIGGNVRLYFDRTKWRLCSCLYAEDYPEGSECLIKPEFGIICGYEAYGEHDFGRPEQATAFARTYLIPLDSHPAYSCTHGS